MGDGFHDLLRSTMEALTRDLAHDATPIEHTLTEVTAAAVGLISAVKAADVLLIDGDVFTSMAPTSELGPAMDDAQRDTGQGPCLDAARGSAVVRCDDMGTDPRWPDFSAIALDAGVRSMLSYQLYTHGAGSGALNLFSDQVNGFNQDGETVGAMLATHAATALIAANRQHQFESALASRDVIGQAKGMLMERFDVDAVRAFDLLRRLSQSSNTPLHQIAAKIVASGPEQRDLR